MRVTLHVFEASEVTLADGQLDHAFRYAVRKQVFVGSRTSRSSTGVELEMQRKHIAFVMFSTLTVAGDCSERREAVPRELAGTVTDPSNLSQLPWLLGLGGARKSGRTRLGRERC
jgi:hypothetical protein